MTGYLELGEHGVWIWASYGVAAATFLFLIISARVAVSSAIKALEDTERAAPSAARLDGGHDA